MIITETQIFTKQILKLLSDDEYMALQKDLVRRPNSGDIIRHSGGLRKVRWKGSGRGKRGGIRVIYYWQVSDDEIFMLLAFGKNEKNDLSAKELQGLKAIVEETFK